MPLMNRDQVGRSMVTMAITKRASRTRMPVFSSRRVRLTCGGVGGIEVVGILVTIASDEPCACPDADAVDEQHHQEDDHDQRAEPGVVEEVQVTHDQLADAACPYEADDDRGA